MARPKPNLSWIGQTLGGRYKIDEYIDQGGMSSVYKASDPNLQRTVAVKLIHQHLSNDQEFVRRFEQEAASVAKLRHSNIIQVYDFNHDNDTYYMVMEFVPGQTLKDKLKALSAASQSLPLAEIIHIMSSMCEAVAYAHDHGMIHRDLKPANVMLAPKGQVVLMDFGVAKMLGGQDRTATGAIIGTAKYMSPEQARGDRPDERSDIYALGVMLYELVAGEPPFDADTTVPILMKHVNEPVPDIRIIQQDVPDELVDIIETALAKDPANRYQSASHMSAALNLLKRLGQTSGPMIDAQRTVTSRKKRQSTEPSSINLPRKAQPKPSISDTMPEQSTPVSPSNSRMMWIGGAVVGGLILIVGIGALLFYLFGPSSGESQASGPGIDPNLPSSEGMVRIEAAVYTVGLDTADKDHAPRQNIELSEFWLDQREVTNAAYAEFLAATGQSPPSTWSGGNFPADQENFPVMGVAWEQAKAYCEWNNKRLPAEAEWEIGARGSEGRLFPWGDNQRAVNLPRSGTYKVGSKTTNQSPFGIFDMAGNVWEWVDQPYAPIPDGQRILRGGTNDFLKDMAYRLTGDPTTPTMFASAGMRCAADQVNVTETDQIAEDVLYEDTFDSPGSGWPILAEGAFFYGYHPPDYYHLEVGTPDNRATISRPPNFDNVTVEADILVDHTTSESGDFRYGLVLRQISEDQYYAFTISTRTSTWYILKSTADGLETLRQGPVNTLQGFAPAGFTPDKTDKLRIDANGSDFVFHINDQAVAQFSDSDYAEGEVGFLVENFDEELAHVHFDTLKIRQPETGPIEIASSALIDDQFTDPSSGWPTEDEEGTPYRIGYHPPDYYHLEPRVANEYVAVSLSQSFKDVTVETDAFIDHTDTETGDFRYGLVARRSAEDQFYAFTVSPRQGMWQVLKSSAAGLELLKEGPVDTLQGFAPAGFTPDKSDKLRVDASGSNFIFHINGKRITKLSDSEYAEGEVGFFAENLDESLTHVHYEALNVRPVEITPAQVTTLLEDQFTDPSSGWPTEDVEGATYRVGYHPPDYYHVEPRAAAERVAVSFDQTFQDITIETDAFIDHTDTDDGGFRYGLILRRVAEDQFYAFTVTPRSASWEVLKSSAAGVEVLAEGEVDTLRGFAPAGFTPDKTDKLRVDALGSTFTYYINDEPIIQVSDSDYPAGEAGFLAETFDETLTHVHYESLTIIEVDPEAIAQAPTPEPTPEPPTPSPEPTAETISTPTEEPSPTPTPEPSAPEGMVLVPAGHFLMGSTTGQAIERPEHPVFLDAFYIHKFEVTNAQYRKCVRERGCTQGGANSATRSGYRDDLTFDDHPVVSVTWDQANAYCRWAGYNLPSEAQWEYAASGSDNLRWPWGNSFDAKLSAASAADTQPVGSYPEGVSPFGLFDMAGNVGEWVADDFDEEFYANSPTSNPLRTDVSAGRIYRGGSFGGTNSSFYTTSRRYGNIRTFGDITLGFRCALDAPELTPSEERGTLVAEFCEVYDAYKPGELCP